MKKWETFKTELLKDKEVAREYNKLAPRYAIISQLIAARQKSGLTQKELANRIGTKQSAIARLESGNTNPSIGFLEKIASVMDTTLTVQLQ
jgi:ribosome-binding protein aMBF1 (putative translation factor)